VIEYRIKPELHISSLLGIYTAFGIQAYRQNRLLLYIPDVFCHRYDAERLVEMCNRLHLDVIHLKDVIEDALT